MPKPAELREQVRAELDARSLRHRRCAQMLEEAARRRNAPVVQETLEERLRNTVAIYRKYERFADADRVQRKLDDLLQERAPT
jgi:nitric oxide reductase activation protein